MTRSYSYRLACALLCLLLAGCNEPSNAEMAACMKSRPNDSSANSNCWRIIRYEMRSK